MTKLQSNRDDLSSPGPAAERRETAPRKRRVNWSTHLALGVGLLFGASAEAKAVPSVSVKQWAHCDGVTDDHDNFLKALTLAKTEHVDLIVDCNIAIHIGTDIVKPIFLPSNMIIAFSPAGSITVDNITIPAFVINNSQYLTLTNWRIYFKGTMDEKSIKTAFYNGKPFPVNAAANSPAANLFNDVTLKQWTTKNLGVHYGPSANPLWQGPTNSSTIFLIRGGAHNITFANFRASAPGATAGPQFIPMLFSLLVGEKPGTYISQSTPVRPEYYAIPRDLTFTNIDIDQSVFGWQGTGQNINIEKVISRRYSDIVYPDGSYLIWFAPPHLFYFSFRPEWDAALFNKNIKLTNIDDEGERVGAPRSWTSGNCYSLKLLVNEGSNSVINYTSLRKDGFMDLVSSKYFDFNNIHVEFDSSFLNNKYGAIRLPFINGLSFADANHYENIQFRNLTIIDHAKITTISPIQASPSSVYDSFQFLSSAIKVNVLDPATLKTPGNLLTSIERGIHGKDDVFDISISTEQ